MSRRLFLALLLPLLAAACVAHLVLHSQQWTNLLGLLGLAVIAVRWALGSPRAERECPPDCRKCAESLSWDTRPGGEKR
ncbi:hypothetical protein OH540_21215 [Streptomyces sp. BPPL-273]|uniref:hypothetical protein n=1 Tax=Streptomyces sp. BPPL-273 TaxID=2987533 RepID=UPI0024AFE1EA|nr:hypothetical protein [Streptomyces sp. BPPL-273]WHM32426.1 hypothetical protein OH540_21215 [Streptomyces sp. BPPL-273]